MKFSIIIFFSLFNSSLAFAHGGGLDGSGCHTNRKTGEYHCHGGGQKKESSYLVQPQARSAFTAPLANSGTGMKCGGKTTCGQMSSCAEAKFYLTQCGIYRLDRDSDGVPCETLCGN